MCQWRASDFSVHVHIKQDELERISHEAGKLLDEAIRKTNPSNAGGNATEHSEGPR